MTLTNGYGCSYPFLQPRCFTWIRSNPAEAAMEKNPKAPVDMVDIYAIHIHQQWYDQHMHPLKLTSQAAADYVVRWMRLSLRPLWPSQAAKNPDSHWGKLECLEVIYIYIQYNNYVKNIYLQYIHTYIQIYYNTSCTHTFPIIIHLYNSSRFLSGTHVIATSGSAFGICRAGWLGEFLVSVRKIQHWLRALVRRRQLWGSNFILDVLHRSKKSYRWWFQNVSNILFFSPDPWRKWSNLMKTHLSIRVETTTY